MSREYSIIKSFTFALQGIKTALRKEPNLRIHAALAGLALIAAALLGFTSVEWLVLLITIFLVLILELVNTVFEALIDLVGPDQKPAARIAKDISAGVVLLAAILSVVVGLVLFLPKVL